MVSVEEDIESEKNVETEEDKGESSNTRVVEVVMRDVREADSTRPNEIVSEQTVFKVPLKRKTDKVHDYRQQKKIDLKDVAEHIDSESDSELSDSSVTLSQSEFSSRNFDVDDIKLFLQSTKNKSGGFSQ